MFLSDYCKLVERISGKLTTEMSDYEESKINRLFSKNIVNSLSDSEIEIQLKKIFKKEKKQTKKI